MLINIRVSLIDIFGRSTRLFSICHVGQVSNTLILVRGEKISKGANTSQGTKKKKRKAKTENGNKKMRRTDVGVGRWYSRSKKNKKMGK